MSQLFELGPPPPTLCVDRMSTESKMVKIFLADNSIAFLPYSELKGVYYDGSHTVTAYFTRSNVIFKGNNLHILAEFLAANSAACIRIFKNDWEAVSGQIIIHQIIFDEVR